MLSEHVEYLNDYLLPYFGLTPLECAALWTLIKKPEGSNESIRSRSLKKKDNVPFLQRNSRMCLQYGNSSLFESKNKKKPVIKLFPTILLAN